MKQNEVLLENFIADHPRKEVESTKIKLPVKLLKTLKSDRGQFA